MAKLWIGVAAWLGFIYFMGSSRFGRDGTQRWIDRVAAWPRLNGWLNRRHGTLRAAFHYVEFVTLTLALYWALGRGDWAWNTARAALSAAAASGFAWLDEWHQSRTPGRMFRRIDFIHSLRGVAVAIALIALAHLFLERN